MIFTYDAVIVPSGRIRIITEHGIEYLDDKGGMQFINFEECYQRWLQHELGSLDKYYPPLANEEAFREHFEDWKEVGARYFPDFIQFYSQPQVRFTFDSPNELMRVRMQIWRNGGWQTTDLT